jgi:UDP-glucose 4-epimerase
MATRVIVTGGSGFVASHLVKRLLDKEYEVAITTRYADKVRCHRIAGVWDRLTKIEVDLRNTGALRAIADFKPDIVFHLAAYNHVGRSFEQHEECYDTNFKGTANLLSVISGDTRFIYISSSEIYGYASRQHFPWREDVSPFPVSPYALSKYAAEMHCRLMASTPNPRNILILRPFNIYGPDQSGDAVVPQFISAALDGRDILLSGGEQTRDFNYVDNVIDAMLNATKFRSLVGPLNISSGIETSIFMLAKGIRDLCNSKSRILCNALPLRNREIFRSAGDSRHFDQAFDWVPAVGLEAGLRKTIQWFRTNKDAA